MSFDPNNNRISGYSYDAAGNLLNDGAHSYTYDAENKISKVDAVTCAYQKVNPAGKSVEVCGFGC